MVHLCEITCFNNYSDQAVYKTVLPSEDTINLKMRATSIILSGVIVLAACLLRCSEAVTCTADPTVTGCIDCTTSPTDPECVAEAAANTTTKPADGTDTTTPATGGSTDVTPGGTTTPTSPSGTVTPAPTSPPSDSSSPSDSSPNSNNAAARRRRRMAARRRAQRHVLCDWCTKEEGPEEEEAPAQEAKPIGD
ncbi:GD15156 [Drosophila simulans]|uniref:GD15156 n=1 Tax=Drosophila simulans TaxID=7240 RepID=B4NTB4_DROSI|nr:GD15156 [Drosophila simulans]